MSNLEFEPGWISFTTRNLINWTKSTLLLVDDLIGCGKGSLFIDFLALDGQSVLQIGMLLQPLQPFPDAREPVLSLGQFFFFLHLTTVISRYSTSF
jgi:hypothetical protein